MKKKIRVIVWMMMLLNFMTERVMASDLLPGNGLEIDTESVYENMDMPYGTGYIPRVRDGFVYIVVPIIADEEMAGDRVTASLYFDSSYRSGSTCPFVMKNYTGSFTRSAERTTTGEEKECCLVSFKVELRADRINGSYPVTVRIYATSKERGHVGSEAELYVNITDGKEAESSHGSGTAEGSEGTSSGTGTADGYTGTSQGADLSNGDASDYRRTDAAGENIGTSNGMETADGKSDNVSDTFTGDSVPSDIDNSSVDVESSVQEPGGIDKEEITFSPKLLIDAVRPSSDTIYAGDDFSITIGFLNTSRAVGLRNLSFTVSPVGDEISLAGDRTVFYCDRVGAGEVYELSIGLTSDAAAKSGSYEVDITADYQDDKGNPYSSQGKVTVKLCQELRVSFDPVYVAGEAAVSDIITLDVSVINLGYEGIKNVRAEIAGDGLRPKQTIFMGDVEAGAQAAGMGEIVITALTGETAYGVTTGYVLYTYEDAVGREYTAEDTFSLTVKSPFKPLRETKKEESNIKIWWVVTGAAAVCAAAAITVILFMRRHKRKPTNKKSIVN